MQEINHTRSKNQYKKNKKLGPKKSRLTKYQVTIFQHIDCYLRETLLQKFKKLIRIFQHIGSDIQETLLQQFEKGAYQVISTSFVFKS